MKLPLCSIRDNAIEAFMRPFQAQAEGEAIRMFTDEIDNQQSAMFRHPEDYTLYLIGHFDSSAGLLLPCEPRVLARGRDFQGGTLGRYTDKEMEEARRQFKLVQERDGVAKDA